MRKVSNIVSVVIYDLSHICNHHQEHLDNMACELKVVFLLRDESVVKVAEVEALVSAHLDDHYEDDEVGNDKDGMNTITMKMG